MATATADLYGNKVQMSAVTDLGRAASGARLAQYEGRYFSIPFRGSARGLPQSDALGDQMMQSAQTFANQFNPLKHLSEKQLKAIRSAAPSDRGGLMVAYKGTWVHQKMAAKFSQLKWSTRGIDAQGEEMAYEVMTWTGIQYGGAPRTRRWDG